MYTGLPVVFCTASHFKLMEFKLRFVTEGIPGVGVEELSPFVSEEKFLTLVKNSQLSRQLLDALWNTKQIQLQNGELKLCEMTNELNIYSKLAQVWYTRTSGISKGVDTYADLFTCCLIRIRWSTWTQALKLKKKSTNIKDRKWILLDSRFTYYECFSMFCTFLDPMRLNCVIILNFTKWK